MVDREDPAGGGFAVVKVAAVARIRVSIEGAFVCRNIAVGDRVMINMIEILQSVDRGAEMRGRWVMIVLCELGDSKGDIRARIDGDMVERTDKGPIKLNIGGLLSLIPLPQRKGVVERNFEWDGIFHSKFLNEVVDVSALIE
jgi:hypothetical protein